MKASQQLDLNQELQYRGLFTDELLPIHKEVAYLPRLTQYMFTKHMKHFVETYTWLYKDWVSSQTTIPDHIFGHSTLLF
jgi:hypothetical protein